MKNIVIVESPAKAKTIKGFLGEGFEVESSYGHIRDLSKKNMGVDIVSGFVPKYEVSERSKKVVSKLKKLTKQADMVWLATDEDREGEAIAWHLAEELRLKPENSKRIAFNEITKTAVQKAISDPRSINVDLVDAQQARRVVDRLVGFELSPILWKKIRSGLSAGRVQSVTVRLLIDREHERDSFESTTSWKIESDLVSGDDPFKAAWQEKVQDEQMVQQILEVLREQKLTVMEVEKKPAKSSPPAPFTTSTLQQTVSRLLGYSVKRTMSIAQELYEKGVITYMRTDSVHLSEQAMTNCATYIIDRFSDAYHTKRVFKAKHASAQEAHEAIRPTDFSCEEVSPDRFSGEAGKLYRLIWQRTVASQMADAKINKTNVKLGHQNLSGFFIASGEQIQFEGWLKIQKRKTKEVILPIMEEGQSVSIEQIFARESFSSPPARYNEGSLVRKLEKLGIGRPSTYAPTISTVQDRGYVEKRDTEAVESSYRAYVLKDNHIEHQKLTENTGAERGVLIPTDIAFVVNDFLVKQFPGVIDFQFTAKLERSFDHIAKGEEKWNKMVKEFYDPFHQQVAVAEEIERKEFNSSRELGVDPETNKPLTVRLGRYGPFAQIGDKEEEEKPRYASLRPYQRLDTITFEEALKLFDLPRTLGTTSKDMCYEAMDGQRFEIPSGTEIKSNIGRFGPYLQYGVRNFVSIRGFSPEEITLEEAIEILDQALQKKAAQLLAKFGNIQVLKGRWGPYLSDGEKIATLGKQVKIESLNEESVLETLKTKGKLIKKTAPKGRKTKKTTKTKKKA